MSPALTSQSMAASSKPCRTVTLEPTPTRNDFPESPSVDS